jgi:hypothetical protein
MKAREVEYEMTEQEYEDRLDEIYGEVEICGMTFNSGRALKELDPTAFRCGKGDYESTQDSTWLCGECDSDYDNEDEAEACCNREQSDDERRGV